MCQLRGDTKLSSSPEEKIMEIIPLVSQRVICCPSWQYPVLY